MGALADALAYAQTVQGAGTPAARFGVIRSVLPNAVSVSFDGSSDAFPCDWLASFERTLASTDHAALIGRPVLVLSVSGALVIADLYVKGAK